MSLVQRNGGEAKDAEVFGAGLSPRDLAVLEMGALVYADGELKRNEVEFLLRVQSMKVRGEYARIVPPEARRDGEGPWDALCRVFGIRRKTLDERLRALRELGEGAMRAIVAAGLPHVGIKALLAAPGDLKAELRGKGENGSLTADDLRGILDHVDAAHDRAERAQARAEKEKKRAEKAETEAAKAKDKLIEARQDARDARAELTVERDKKKIVAVEEVKRVWTEVWEHWRRIQELLGMINTNADRQAAAEVHGEFDKFGVAVSEECLRLQEEIAR